MEVLNTNQQLGVIVAFVALIPAILLFRQYFKTRLPDYLLFAIFFVDGSLTLILDPIAGVTNILIAYQLHHLTIDLAYLLLFIHGSRIIWKKVPRPLLVVTVVWYAALFIMTALWQPMTQPATATFFWIANIPHTFSTYYPAGAGLTLNGVIIYSTAYRYWGELFRVYVIAILLYAYINVVPVNRTPRILRAKKIWISVWFVFLLDALTLFPILYEFNQFISLILLIAGALMTYIAVFIPEAMVISKVQAQRAFNLYDRLQKASNEEEIEKLQIESLVMYLKTVKTALQEEKP